LRAEFNNVWINKHIGLRLRIFEVIEVASRVTYKQERGLIILLKALTLDMEEVATLIVVDYVRFPAQGVQVVS